MKDYGVIDIDSEDDFELMELIYPIFLGEKHENS